MKSKAEEILEKHLTLMLEITKESFVSVEDMKAFPEWDITKVQSAVDSDLKFAGRLADNPSLKERVNKYLDAHHQSITMVMYLPEEPFGPVGEYIQNLLH